MNLRHMRTTVEMARADSDGFRYRYDVNATWGAGGEGVFSCHVRHERGIGSVSLHEPIGREALLKAVEEMEAHAAEIRRTLIRMSLLTIPGGD